MLHRIGDVGDPGGVPAGLGIIEAAHTLGITPTALRKRIRRGSLEAHKVGGVWRVLLPTGTPAGEPATDPADTPATYPTAQDAGTPLLDALRDEVADLRRRLDHAEEERERQLTEASRALEREQVSSAELRVLLQRALERQTVLELAAPPAPSESPVPPEPEKPRRSA
jgi:hypothetical protein